MQFANQNRNDVIKRYNLDPSRATEIGKALGDAWRKLSADERKPYEEMAAKDLQRYKFEKSLIPPKLKKLRSAYIFFANANRENILLKQGLSAKQVIDLARATGEAWRNVGMSHFDVQLKWDLTTEFDFS